LIPIVAALSAWGLAKDDADQEWSDRRRWAALVVAVAAVISVAYLKSTAFPQLDQNVSVRGFTRANSIAGACWTGLTRDQVYGLNYYAGHLLPECAEGQRPRIVRDAERLQLQ
jgi:hypothetical protein